ncbi:MAG: hypothetical protein L0Z62_02160 [Gemmataceae bacterium]|nr:hypothetical protein [Gemmataceae bacterium]
MLATIPGCRSGPGGKSGPPDPLTGEPFKGSGPEKAPPRSQKVKAPPPLPTATSVGSPAAIAQGLPGDDDPLFNGGRRLAINNPGAQPVGAWQATPGHSGTLTASAAGQGAGFTLRPPQSMAGPIPAVPERSGVVAPQWGATGSDYDQLQAQLKARKVVWQRQESFGEGFKFSCQVPNPYNPEFNRIYEATARDYRSAILTVIEQIDRDLQQR